MVVSLRLRMTVLMLPSTVKCCVFDTMWPTVWQWHLQADDASIFFDGQ